MKLRIVDAKTADFRFGDRQNILDWMKRNKGTYGSQDCVSFMSTVGRTVSLVKIPTELELRKGGVKRFLVVAVRFSLDGGAWWQNPAEFFTKVRENGIDATHLVDKILAQLEKDGRIEKRPHRHLKAV